jgi:hypothetical protein
MNGEMNHIRPEGPHDAPSYASGRPRGSPTTRRPETVGIRARQSVILRQQAVNRAMVVLGRAESDGQTIPRGKLMTLPSALLSRERASSASKQQLKGERLASWAECARVESHADSMAIPPPIRSMDA